MTTKNAAQKQIDREEQIVKDMSQAQVVAESIFGAQWDTYAVREIYDYLQDTTEEDFRSDIGRVVEQARKIYKTTTPTPEQVFGLFEEIYDI